VEEAAIQKTSRTHWRSARNGRDELNLAEFPLAAISDCVPDGQKTLVFTDTIFDQGKSATITRRLTISASDAYGLPTALDDEVILGLVQVTKQSGFANRRVEFTRYQLIQLLGWRDDGRSYDRIEQSLKRWLGVTLYYDKAWWDNGSRSWVDENFHILEHVTLHDAAPRRHLNGELGREGVHSFFVWNEVVFRSFQAGYLKQLDLDIYRSLESAVAKRMYRFLDKRFYHRDRCEFALGDFACEHIGLSRNYDTAQIKRGLEGAIHELEAVGFLQPMSKEKRYLKVARGDWRIVLVQKPQPQSEPVESADQVNELGQKLVKRGITASVAAELTGEFPANRIEMQLEVFDWLVSQKNANVSKNPAGYLVKAIREGFAAPKAFGRSCRSKCRTQSSQILATPKQRVVVASNAEESSAFRSAIDEYWNRMSPAEREELEQTALAQAGRRMVQGFERSVRNQNSGTAEAYRRMILDRYISRLLGLSEPLQKVA
jgi:hypothetical protein